MTQLAQEIANALGNHEQPSRQWVEQMQRLYPYFNLPAHLYLMRAANHDEREDDMLARLAIAVPDRRDLALTTELADTVFAAFYPPPPPAPAPDTTVTIDTFLDNFGSSNPHEIEALEQAIFNPLPDYADILAAQEQQQNPSRAVAAQTREDELINDFIEQSRREREAVGSPQQMHVESAEVAAVASDTTAQPSGEDDTMLSESLAKIYFSQGKYSKSLEIIENINLKFPEKSIYFADQIRFLRKIVLNEEVKSKS